MSDDSEFRPPRDTGSPTTVQPVASDVQEKATAYMKRIQESIETSECKPKNDVQCAEIVAGAHLVMGETLRAFIKGDPVKPPDKMLTELLRVEKYRAELVTITDFIIMIVDTMAEADIEVFGKEGSTRMLQEMLRK